MAGELVGTASAAQLRRGLQEQYGAEDVLSLEVDLSDVTMIDLEAVAALVASANAASGCGTRMVVTGARGQVREKLRTTGVLRLLEEGGYERDARR
jgi:anti-anti-sigma regulatory factor